ncbi:MAG: phosphodiester glycosidase family protein [Eubacteriales bacterium]|nr:phosphodiester glycosidase family protein [Eubacteriales bacterium]
MNEHDFDLDDILAEFHRAEAGKSAPTPSPVPVREPEPVRESAPMRKQPAAPVPAPEEEEPEEDDEDFGEEEEPEEDDYEEEPADERPARRRRDPDRRRPLLSLLMSLLFLMCLGFSALNIHPSLSSSSGRVGTQTAAPAVTAVPTPEPVVYTPEPVVEPVQTPETAATPEPTPEPIHYRIPEGTLVAPAPRPEGYGSVSNDNAAQMLEVIQRARDSGLLGEDERMVFDPNANFYRGGNAKDIRYYIDDTILVILWKEDIEGNSVTFTEVKVADGSQLRRKLADDSFGVQVQYFASELAHSTNAVVAMNADYYLFRDFGIVAYDRELYRFNTGNYSGQISKYNCVDTLFVTSGGDFLYKRVGEESSRESILQFMQENDVLFTIAFGPVLVENGQPLVCDWYPVGEINSGYSRAGIGQVSPLHYLYMSLNHSPEKEARWTVNTFAQHFAEKGVITAYCLDGGQTGEVVFQGEPYNYIDFNKERQVSDILYFATALPEEGGAIG